MCYILIWEGLEFCLGRLIPSEARCDRTINDAIAGSFIMVVLLQIFANVNNKSHLTDSL